jgi:hypothetical protein
MPDENGNNQLLDGTEFRVVAPSALEALERAEVDIAITTARKYPRDIAQSLKTCRELALRNQQIAKTCNYAVPRGGKLLVGPSVHFARMVAYAWGNQSALSRVIGCDRDNAHLQGVFHDLQTNSRIGIEMDWPVQPPKVDSPERWKDQMGLAKRGGSAIALRTAIFNCIPMALFLDISETAKLVAIGEGKTFLESRNAAVVEFKELGVSQEQLYAYLDVGGLESINTDHLIHLYGILQSIRDHTLSVTELFGKKEDRFEKARAPGRSRSEKEEVSRPSGVDAREQNIVDKTRDSISKIREREAPSASSGQAQKQEKPAATVPVNVSAAHQDIMEEAKSAEEAKKPKAEQKKAPEAPKPAPPPEPLTPSLLDQVRDKLEEAKIPELRMVAWLQAVQVMGAHQTTLDTCADQYLTMLLGQWDETLELMGKFSAEEQEAVLK